MMEGERGNERATCLFFLSFTQLLSPSIPQPFHISVLCLGMLRVNSAVYTATKTVNGLSKWV